MQTLQKLNLMKQCGLFLGSNGEKDPHVLGTFCFQRVKTVSMNIELVCDSLFLKQMKALWIRPVENCKAS